MVEEKEKGGKPKCVKCGSSFTYIRIKEGSVVCRSCGHIEQREE